MFINNDYSQATLMKRKMLWESARNDKDEGARVYLFNDKLHVNDDVFVWDENKNTRASISTQIKTTRSA